MLLPPGQGSDAAPSLFHAGLAKSSAKSCFLKDRFVPWEIQSTKRSVGTCNFFFFFCKNIDFPARSLNCSSNRFIAWVGGFPSAFKSTFPLKMSLREGCFFFKAQVCDDILNGEENCCFVSKCQLRVGWVWGLRVGFLKFFFYFSVSQGKIKMVSLDSSYHCPLITFFFFFF